MGKESIIHETVRVLKAKTKFGQSKHEAKQKERERCLAADEKYIPGKVEGIYSYSTYHTYVRHCLDFAEWAREQQGAKSLKQARSFVADYLQKEIEGQKSAWTIRLEAAALAKLYDCSSSDFGVKLPTRQRENITRSRESKAHDREFSEKRNQDLVNFCRGTGLRRKEVSALTPADIYERDGAVWVFIKNGKGGRRRESRVVSEYADHVLAMKAAAEAEGRPLVFGHVPNRADIHAYRSEYAEKRYREILSDHAQLERAREYWRQWKESHNYTGPETYSRRGEGAKTFDRAVLLAVSGDLGHNRVDVVARYYLR
jgi:integrase